MPVNDGSNIRITPFTPMEMPDMAKEVSSLFSAMRRASGGGGGLGGQIMFNPVTNQFERIPGGSPKERQMNMDAMNNMRVQAAWNNAENKNVQAIQKKLQDFENASVERKNQIIDDIRRNDIPKLANDSGIDGRAFIAGPLKDLEQRQQEAAQQVAKTGALDVLWDSARIGLRNFTDSLADLGSNAQEQAARANARQQYIEQVRNENAYLQNSARRQAEGADFMDRFSGREVLAAAGEFAGQNIPTFGAMALGGAIGGALGGAIGLGARGASMVGQAIPGAITGAGQQMTASVDAILSDTTKTTEQKMQELEDAQTSSRLFGGALGAVVMPVGQGIRRAVSEGLANRGIGGSQVAQTIRNQRAAKALPNEVTSWDEALANARRADIEAENALIRGRSLARFRQQAADSALEGALFGTAGQLGTNVIANDPIGTNMGAATLGGLVGGLGFTPFNRRTLRTVPNAPFVDGIGAVGVPVDVNQQRIVDAAWDAYNGPISYPPVETLGAWSAPSREGEFGFRDILSPDAVSRAFADSRVPSYNFGFVDDIMSRENMARAFGDTTSVWDNIDARRHPYSTDLTEGQARYYRAMGLTPMMGNAAEVPSMPSSGKAPVRPGNRSRGKQPAQPVQQVAPQAVQQQAAAPSATDVAQLDSLAAGEHAKLTFSTAAVGDAYRSIANHIRKINSLGKEARNNGYINNKLSQKTNSIIDKLSPDELRNLADHMNVYLQYEAHRSANNRVLQPTALLYKAKDAHTRQVIDYIQSRLNAPAQSEPSQAQQQFIKQNSSPNPPKAADNQTPASISTSRLPENETGEQGLNLMGPNAFVPKQQSVQQPAASTQQPIGDVPRNQPQPSTDKAVSSVIQNILKKWGRYKAGAPKGGLHTTSENNINKAVDALTPEQKQALVQTIDSYQGLNNLSKVKYTQRAIQYAYDRAKNPAPVQEGATNAQQPAAQPRPVQGAKAEPAANPATTQQQAADAAAAINTVAGSGGEQTAARLEQSVNAGAPAANRGDTDSDSGGKAVDTGNPAANANSVSQGTPVVGKATEERGNAGTEAQQSGETPKTEGTPEPKVTEQQAADGERGPEPAATVNAETGEGTGGAGLEGGTGPRNGRNAADAGSNKQSGDESGDGDGAVKQQEQVVATPEQADRQQVAASSFNVKVSPDGGITSSRDGWRFNDGAITNRARKNVEYDPATGISYNVKRVANNDRNFTPGRTLYPTGVRRHQAPAIIVHISNADGAVFDIVFSNADATKYSPNWIPNIKDTGITVDKDMVLHIDPNTTNPELRRAMSGDGAMVNVTAINTAGQPITSNGQVGSRTFPLLPNEWAIKPTVQETLQAKANRDTAVAAAKDAKDTATSQKLMAPKAEGQDPADAKVLEDLATITKTDAQTPVKTPEQEAAKTPQRRTPQKKADEGQSKTKKKTDDQKSDTKTRRRVVVDAPAEKPAEKPEEPAEQAPANPREEAEAQATAAVESKIDARTESYDYGYDDGMATVAQRLSSLKEEQIDAMADRIYELQEQGVAAVNQHPVTTEEAPTMVMSFINDMPPKQLEQVIQAAGVRNLSAYKRGGRATVDPMMVAEDMTYALIANDIARKAADAGVTLKLSPMDQAYISLANKQGLPPVQLSADEKALLDVWLGDATIPLRERQDIETAFDVVITTPDEARKRILEKSQSAACATARKRNKTRVKNDEKAAASQEAAAAAERAAEQRDIAKHNAEAREISFTTRNAITNG